MAISLSKSKTISISRKLTLSLTVLVTIMFAVTLIFSWKVNRVHERKEMHEGLLTRAEAIISLTEQENGVIEIDFAD